MAPKEQGKSAIKRRIFKAPKDRPERICELRDFEAHRQREVFGLRSGNASGETSSE